MPKSKEIWDDGECPPIYDFWKRTAYWTIEEGVALTLDKEPRKFNAKTLETAPRDIPVVASFFEWLELGNRAVAKAKLAEMPLPSEFLEWRAMTDLGGQVGVLHNGEEIDSRPMFFLENDKGNPFSFIDYKESYLNLETAYNAKCNRIEDLEGCEWELNDLWEQIEAGKFETEKPRKRGGFDDRKRKSLLKIILSISIQKYHFNPKKLKNSASKNIESATVQCGLSITDETIRSLLREAVDCFPDILDFFEDE